MTKKDKPKCIHCGLTAAQSYGHTSRHICEYEYPPYPKKPYIKHPQRGKATKEAIATIPEYECKPASPKCRCGRILVNGICPSCKNCWQVCTCSLEVSEPAEQKPASSGHPTGGPDIIDEFLNKPATSENCLIIKQTIKQSEPATEDDERPSYLKHIKDEPCDNCGKRIEEHLGLWKYCYKNKIGESAFRNANSEPASATEEELKLLDAIERNSGKMHSEDRHEKCPTCIEAVSLLRSHVQHEVDADRRKWKCISCKVSPRTTCPICVSRMARQAVENATEQTIHDTLNGKLRHNGCDGCVDKTVLSNDRLTELEQQAVEKAMGELRTLIIAGKTIEKMTNWKARDGVIELINARYPAIAGKGKEVKN